MRLAIAVLAALAFGWIGLGMVRSLASRPGSSTFDEPVDATVDVRTLFWCQTCGTELLLLRRGSEKPPRHCGETMHERQELVEG